MSFLDGNPGGAFGAWLREMREARGAILRVAAAAADMDPALLSKIELGKRCPTDECALALQRFLGADVDEFQRRLRAARFWRAHGDDPALAVAVAAQVQEDAAAYGAVNKSVKKKK
jgi:transcriptional regulator with XRE-family HTH domain